MLISRKIKLRDHYLKIFFVWKNGMTLVSKSTIRPGITDLAHKFHIKKDQQLLVFLCKKKLVIFDFTLKSILLEFWEKKALCWSAEQKEDST
jgi:hypothetical protein